METPMHKARTAAGLTAIALAEIAGTTEQRVYMVERGRYRPRTDEAARIARVLGVSVEALFPNLKGGKP